MNFKLVEKLTTPQIYQVYHGSPYKFDKFSLKNFKKHDAGQWGKGIYFTDKEEVAKNWAENGYIYTANIVFDNPLTVNAKNPGLVAKLIIENGSEKATEILKQKGYDGIIVKNDNLIAYDYEGNFKPIIADQYIVFDPEKTNIIQTAYLSKMAESLSTHSSLNQKLFDKNNKLKEDIRETLLNIADTFVEELKEKDIPLKVYDYWVVGSNAAYNYQPNSDIDLHIIVDTESIDVDENVLKLLYDYAKSSFNDKHNIFIKEQPVEVYLEDMNTSAISNGIYSLKKDEWIKIPSPEEDKTINIEDTPEYNKWYKNYTVLVHNNSNIEDIQKFIDDLYILRKESLAKDGEFSIGNLIFKEFRNQGIIQELKDKVIELKDKELTLEGINEKTSSNN